jgi:hypothetical protein
MYKSIPDGFRKIHAAEGMKGFTLVSHTLIYYSLRPWSTSDSPSSVRPNALSRKLV